ncbi:DUF58 domain-containing protein [Pleionea litopenaei]|uniref:DUF58 domain-containing protein n=1 Tax=Pleionea litopenaei TaxID=3070815 RepID=A0AA51X7U7_9GAMM|nr:DUF58 domain-containing protein [Pleionea sp. HL-JVS1]WMS87475.1 DUF58 domain-containing protein [Pleionea sp. HL-JVS1]
MPSVYSQLLNRWSDVILQWQKRRSPVLREIRLTQKNIYILPTRFGLLMALVTFLMGVGATNYQNNLIFITTFACMTLGVLGILLTFNNLVSTRFSIHPINPIFAGEIARCRISAASNKTHFAVNLNFKREDIQSLDILPKAEQHSDLSLSFATRGIYSIPPIRVSTQYPFGFFQAWSWLFFDAQVVVYPQPLKPEDIHLAKASGDSDYTDQYKDGIEDFYGLKAYQSGESMSRIHWKSYAQEKGLQTKHFVDYVSDPDSFNFDAFEESSTEKRLSYLCYLVLEAARQGRQFGLILPGRTIPVNSGVEHQDACLLALAQYGTNS